MDWKGVRKIHPLNLYAGTITRGHEGWIGLSLGRDDERHVRHDCTRPMPLPHDSVYIYQSEDVFEHIAYGELPDILMEIFRVLEPGGLFRWSMPDYRCDILIDRSLKDENGNIVFDPGGGGAFEGGRVVNGGHLWFPVYETVLELVNGSPFSSYDFLHYYTQHGEPVLRDIDFSLGHIQRVPPHDERVSDPPRPMSIVVDLWKE